MTLVHHGLVAMFLFALGSSFGSFLNVVIHRLPAGKSLWHPPSACPGCHGRIAWYDNVPVIAWIWLHGRCRTCKASIPARYPIVEAATGLLAVALYVSSSIRAGGDLLDAAGAPAALASRLVVAMAAVSAGWIATETMRPEVSRAAGWVVVGPSLLVVAWTLLVT